MLKKSRVAGDSAEALDSMMPTTGSTIPFIFHLKKVSQELQEMSFMYVLAMTAAELVGNAHLKWFADEGKSHNLMFGILAWMAVLFFLIKTLANSSMMWTCIMWEAMIVIGGAITAWLFFGEKFTHWIQWLGLLFAIAAALCINYKCGDSK